MQQQVYPEITPNKFNLENYHMSSCLLTPHFNLKLEIKKNNTDKVIYSLSTYVLVKNN
jgi:hypothetical protein